MSFWLRQDYKKPGFFTFVPESAQICQVGMDNANKETKHIKDRNLIHKDTQSMKL